MQAMKTHVAGVDVHKEILAITVLVGATDQEPVATQFECSTFTDDLMACGLKMNSHAGCARAVSARKFS